MIVHADKAGHNGAIDEVKNLRARWYRRGDHVSHSRDGAVTND